MPFIGITDVVNKTDEEITLEPGESIEMPVKIVGDEVRLEEYDDDDESEADDGD